MAADSKNLVATLKEIRLVDQADLTAVANLQSRFPDAKALGVQLVRAGLLTHFQANQLLQGRGADLVLGPYRVLDRLGEGGMGQVFKAKNERLGRVVALKVIRKDKLADPQMLERFHREIRAAAQLSHVNIVRAFDADAIGGCHLLEMEYRAGSRSPAPCRFGPPAITPGRRPWACSTPMRKASSTGTSSQVTSWSPSPTRRTPWAW